MFPSVNWNKHQIHFSSCYILAYIPVCIGTTVESWSPSADYVLRMHEPFLFTKTTIVLYTIIIRHNNQLWHYLFKSVPFAAGMCNTCLQWFAGLTIDFRNSIPSAILVSILHILWYLSEDTHPISKPAKYLIMSFILLPLDHDSWPEWWSNKNV